MILVPSRRTGPELLDLPRGSYSREELAGSLADIRKVNRYLGDVSAVLTHMEAMAGGLPPGGAGGALTVLDVATGSADIPVAIVDWARKKGLGIKVTAVDSNPEVISIARPGITGYPEITLAVADGRRLPFKEKSFDIVLCTKALHHFTYEEAGVILKDMARTASKGYLLIDIRRSWVAFSLIYILTRLFTVNRLTRYDGPLSVLRSFTVREFGALAAGAGLDGFRVFRHPFWRLVLVGGVDK